MPGLIPKGIAPTLEAYEKMRRQWLTDISHELRTPLAVMRGAIETIQDGIREPTPANMASLHAEILRISKLVEDLHLPSMADSDKFNLKKAPISPDRILQTIVDGHGARFARCRIYINVEIGGIEDKRIKGDSGRLGQVFTNILE